MGQLDPATNQPYTECDHTYQDCLARTGPASRFGGVHIEAMKAQRFREEQHRIENAMMRHIRSDDLVRIQVHEQIRDGALAFK